MYRDKYGERGASVWNGKILLMEGGDARDKYMKQLFESIHYSDVASNYKARMKPKKQ